MRILVCPTAFKGTLGASAVVAALSRGAREARPDAEVVRLPLSDGGPGLLESLAAAEPSSTVEHRPARDPLGRETGGRLLLPEGDAVVESADACGLHHLAAEERDPLRTDTRGVGDLVRAALTTGADRVYVGLGGSATCDGGTGMARVLGWRFLDGAGRELPPGGGALVRLEAVEGGFPEAVDGDHARGDEPVRRGPAAPEASGAAPANPAANSPASPPAARFHAARIHALADVSNPLLGERGAARVFAPQKGADADAVERLEAGLRRLVERTPGEADRLAGVPGAGAAGGLGFGLAAFAGAEVTSGAEWVLRRTGFGQALREADLVLTGEGAFDATSGMGKVTGHVIRLAAREGVPAALVCGRVEGELPDHVTAHAGAEDGGRLSAEDLTRLASEAVLAADEGA